MRTKIFISHANPEDNLFAFWLATKLSLCGYEVWADLKEFSGGEYMWNEITDSLETETLKYLFILSKSSIKKQGALNELAKAMAVQKKYANELINFIIPIRLDDFNYLDSRPELINIFSIDFNKRWAEGLNELIIKFEKENVSKTNTKNHQQWFRQIFSQYYDTALIEKTETLISNWFPITSTNNISLIKTESRALNEAEVEKYPFPAIRQGNYLLTFADLEEIEKRLPILDYESQNENDFINSEKGILFKGEIILKDSPNRKYVELLNQAFDKSFSNRAHTYELSDKLCYYFTLNELPEMKIKIAPYHKRPIQLIGNYSGNYWHFGISGFARLFPIKSYTIKTHILFSEDGYNVYDSVKKQHRLRRKMSRNRYNNFWKNSLFSMVYYLSSDGSVKMDVGNQNLLEFSVKTMELESNFGLEETKIRRHEEEILDE